MVQHIECVALVVREYDEAIAFYRDRLGFSLIEDTDRGDGKRWVRVSPPGTSGPCLLLARAATPEQLTCVGNQTGGRVFLFIHTNDFDRDYHAMLGRGVIFRRPPRDETYGRVAVFEDLYGNLFDLIGPITPPC